MSRLKSAIIRGNRARSISFPNEDFADVMLVAHPDIHMYIGESRTKRFSHTCRWSYVLVDRRLYQQGGSKSVSTCVYFYDQGCVRFLITLLDFLRRLFCAIGISVYENARSYSGDVRVCVLRENCMLNRINASSLHNYKLDCVVFHGAVCSWVHIMEVRYISRKTTWRSQSSSMCITPK